MTRSSYSIRRRLVFTLLSTFALSYAAILLGTDVIIRRDRLQRHERMVMATAEAIDKNMLHEIEEGRLNENTMLRILNDFSAKRVLVWLSRPGEPPLFPQTDSSRHFFDDRALLVKAGVDAPGMQKPRSFQFNSETYFTCSMPLSGQLGVLRFLEDVGVNPAKQRQNQIALLIVWISLSAVAFVLISLVLRYSFRPLVHLEKAMDDIALRSSGNVAECILEDVIQPIELQPIISSFNNLSTRLQDAWTQNQLYMRSISHELSTPLAVISASARLLQRRLSNAPERDQDLIRTAANEAANSERLVRMLTDLARSESGNIKLDLALVKPFKVIEHILASSAQLPSWVDRLKFEPVGDLVELKRIHCLVDEGRLAQCINNLIENSIKYSPVDQPIILSLLIQSESAIIRVADFGPGIPPAERENIFKPFYRTQSTSTETAGSGVGLALVAKLVERMNGTIGIVDQDPFGTVIQMSFPLVVPT